VNFSEAPATVSSPSCSNTDDEFLRLLQPTASNSPAHVVAVDPFEGLPDTEPCEEADKENIGMSDDVLEKYLQPQPVAGWYSYSLPVSQLSRLLVIFC